MRSHMLTSWAMAVLALLLSLGICLGQTEQPGDEIQSLVAAEHAFAQAAIEQGIRAAFLSYLAEDAVIFRPHAVPGKRWFEEHPAPAGILTWEPVFAEVSRAGDLGYTTGPWEFREKNLSDPPIQFGDYVTLWRKQPGGEWRAVLDVGTVHAQPEAPAAALSFPTAIRGPAQWLKRKADVAAERAGLLEQERSFSRLAESKGVLATSLSYAADDIRFYRKNAFPALGKEALRVALADETGALACQPTAADVSASGDLGYTYGTCESRNSDATERIVERSSFVRIWRKQPDGGWKVVLDISIPIPPPATKPDH